MVKDMILLECCVPPMQSIPNTQLTNMQVHTWRFLIRKLRRHQQDQLDKIAKKDQDIVTSLYLKIGDKEYNRADLSKYRIHTDFLK